jgi:hypothetical protein
MNGIPLLEKGKDQLKPKELTTTPRRPHRPVVSFRTTSQSFAAVLRSHSAKPLFTTFTRDLPNLLPAVIMDRCQNVPTTCEASTSQGRRRK